MKYNYEFRYREIGKPFFTSWMPVTEKNSKVIGDRTTLQLPKHNGIETGDLQIRVAADPATNRLAGKILHSDAPYTSKVDPKLDVSSTFEYEVCLSFAGEDREFVECVASRLRENTVRVFYDKYEQVILWGKNLYEHLDEIYRIKSKYCVMFISKHYKEKLWSSHERKSIQARAFEENQEYILPFRLDDTEIPGILKTIAYLSIRDMSCEELANEIYKKIRG